eukprot:8679327-Pyramimonas_sp.AAC.1
MSRAPLGGHAEAPARRFPDAAGAASRRRTGPRHPAGALNTASWRVCSSAMFCHSRIMANPELSGLLPWSPRSSTGP